MSNKKQTAVTWLIEQLNSNLDINHSWRTKQYIDQAKAMEKEQIIDSYNQDLYGGLNGYKKFDNGEQYYTETYGE
jgi:hypothetical protein